LSYVTLYILYIYIIVIIRGRCIKGDG